MNQTYKKLFFVKELSVPVIACITALLLTACAPKDRSDDPVEPQLAPDVPVQGAAVKGPLTDAVVGLYIIDYSAETLKGEQLSSGTTDSLAAIRGLDIPRERIPDGPFLIEFTEGRELNSSAPVVPTLRAIMTANQAESGTAIYATPITTLILELARLNADLTNPGTAQSNFLVARNTQQALIRESFGLGLLDTLNLETTAPLLTETGNQVDALAYRTVIEVFAALLNQLQQQLPDTTSDQLFMAVAVDLADGTLDGRANGDAIDALAGVSALELVTLFSQTPEQLMTLVVPATNITVAQLNRQLIDEAAAIAPGVMAEQLPTPAILALVPGIDSDGDGVIDSLDEFKDDPSRIGDGDGDGVDDLIDEFLDDITEWRDTDADGVGDNADAFPFDAEEQFDSDGDGVGDNADYFKNDSNKQTICDSDDPQDLIDGRCIEDDDGDGIANKDDPFPNDPDNINTLSVANPGPDLSIDKTVAGDFIITLLDASDSSDANVGQTLTYSWQVIAVPTNSGTGEDLLDKSTLLVNSNTAFPTFNGEYVGRYTFVLTVNDGIDDSLPVAVNIDINKAYMISASHLFGTALVAFSLAIPARRRKIKQSNAALG